MRALHHYVTIGDCLIAVTLVVPIEHVYPPKLVIFG